MYNALYFFNFSGQSLEGGKPLEDFLLRHSYWTAWPGCLSVRLVSSDESFWERLLLHSTQTKKEAKGDARSHARL